MNAFQFTAPLLEEESRVAYTLGTTPYIVPLHMHTHACADTGTLSDRHSYLSAYKHTYMPDF